MNFQTLGRIGSIEKAVEAMQKAIDTLQAELTEIKAQQSAKKEERPILRLKKNG